jgi:hypothetical protein
LDKGGINTEKFCGMYYNIPSLNNYPLTNNFNSDFLLGKSDHPVSINFYDEKRREKNSLNEDLRKTKNQLNAENNSCKSDVNSILNESKSYLNFHSLPMYGVCEKATQTMVTGTDIE